MKEIAAAAVVGILITLAIALFFYWLEKLQRRAYIKRMHSFLYDQLFNEGKNADKLL